MTETTEIKSSVLKWQIFTLKAFLTRLFFQRLNFHSGFTISSDYFILWMPVILGAGIIAYFSLRFEPAAIALYVPTFLMWVMAGLAYPKRYDGFLAATICTVLIILSLFMSGISLSKLRTDLTQTPMLTKSIGPVELSGVVQDIDILEEESGFRAILTDLEIEKLSENKTPYSIRLTFRKHDPVPVGSRIQTLAKLNPPSAPVAPGAFDFQKYAYFKKMGGFGFAFKPPEVMGDQHVEANKISVFWERLRLSISDRIRSVLPEHQAATIVALVTGERVSITKEDREALRQAGLAHLLAISGLHVGLVGGILFFFSRGIMALFPRFSLYHPIKKYAAFLSFLGIIFYTFLVGAPVPTIRALFMTGLVLFAVMIDRVAISLRMVALAATGILIFQPNALLGASFQLSFAAVTGLVAFYEAMRRYYPDLYRGADRFRRMLLYILGVSLTTIVASLATGPLIVYHFQEFPLLSLPSNIIAMPLMGFIVMPAAVMAMVLSSIGLDTYLWMVAGYGVELIIEMSRDIASVKSAILTPPMWPPSALLFLTLSFLCLCLLRGRYRTLSCLFLLFGVISIWFYKQPDIMISSSGKLAAIKAHDARIYVSSRVAERFISKSWMQIYGQGHDKTTKWHSLDTIHCDESGCLWNHNNKIIGFSYEPHEHDFECANVHLLIARDPVKVKDCKAVVIDKFDLYFNGAHAIWLDDMQIKSVKQIRGQRPWTISHRR